MGDAFLNRVLRPHVLRNNQSNPVLFLDQASCNRARSTVQAFSDAEIGLEFIPGRMTHLHQPADLSWFGLIKRAFRRLWSEWFLNGEKSYTRSGNMKSPGYALVRFCLCVCYRVVSILKFLKTGLKLHIHEMKCTRTRNDRN